MSFEMKYDKDRNPITQAPQPEPELNSDAAVVNEENQGQLTAAAAETIEPVTPQESPQAKNFRTLREQKDKAERERDEAVRLAQEYANKFKAPEPEEDLGFSLGDNDLAEGKHLSKLAKEVKKLKQELYGYRQKTTEEVTEAKIKAQYPDFDKVVNAENVQSLREMYPEIAATLNSSNDLYGKAVSAYTMIKKFGIIQEENKFQADIDRAQKNAAKPRALTSVSPQQGDSPLSRANAFANGLTEEVKTQLWKEMNDIRRNS